MFNSQIENFGENLCEKLPSNLCKNIQISFKNESFSKNAEKVKIHENTRHIFKAFSVNLNAKNIDNIPTQGNFRKFSENLCIITRKRANSVKIMSDMLLINNMRKLNDSLIIVNSRNKEIEYNKRYTKSSTTNVIHGSHFFQEINDISPINYQVKIYTNPYLQTEMQKCISHNNEKIIKTHCNENLGISKDFSKNFESSFSLKFDC